MREGRRQQIDFLYQAQRPRNKGIPSCQRLTVSVEVWKDVGMFVSRMARWQQRRGGDKWTASSFSGHRFGSTEERNEG